MKELEFINTIKNTICDSSYIGNDTAYIKDRNIIATKDVLVENVHFRLKTISAFDLGYKAVAVNLSDIAAAGAQPEFLLIALAIPRNIDKRFIEEFYKGADFLTQKYNVKIIGGDITSSDKLFISITAIGKMIHKSVTSRDFAIEGQVVVITGEHGNSKAGLEILENNYEVEDKEFFIKAHTNPQPRVNEGLTIAQECEENFALMDTSDGLADALYKIATASNVSIEIDNYLIPVNKNLEQLAKITNKKAEEFVFFGGEDYELLACLPESTYKLLIEKGMQLFKIGKVVQKDDNEPVKIYSNGEKIFSITDLESTFNHFG